MSLAGFELPTIRTPIAVMFFIVSAVAGYYAVDKPGIMWVSQSAFVFFVALGPVRWLESLVLALPWTRDRRSREARDIEDTVPGNWVSWVSYAFQLALILYGLYLAVVGVFDIPGFSSYL